MREGTEKVASNAKAYSSTCIGAKRFNSDIMVSMLTRDDEKNPSFWDFFLTDKQAVDLANSILNQVHINERGNDELN